MQILIAAIGKSGAGPEHALASRYLTNARRSGKQVGLTGFDIFEHTASRASNVSQRKSDEAGLLLSRLNTGDALIALDETGRTLTSLAFSQKLFRLRDDGTRKLVFVIGGPDGLDETVRHRADMTMSLSALTWPHQVARALLCEQLYRVVAIASGHPYHRE